MLNQRLQQKLLQKLSPQQILLMKLLQIPSMALEQRIKQEIEENPALELPDEAKDNEDEENFEEMDDTPVGKEDEPETDDFKESSPEDEFDFNDYLDEDEIPAYRMAANNQSPDDDQREVPFAAGTSFQEYLISQLGLRELTEKQYQIGLTIIGNLDDTGYLQRDPDAMTDDLVFSQNLEATKEEILEVLKVIQDLDPPGIGARNLQECLLIQLRRQEQRCREVELAETILERHFDEFTRKHYDKIIKKARITEEDLKGAIQEILKLNPKPGDSVSETSRLNNYVIPDFSVRNINGELELSLNSRNAPELRINRSYIDMMEAYSDNKHAKGKEALLFVKQKIDSAKWFIDAIKQRQNTLYLTMQAIMDYQEDYFRTGDETKLRPMILKDIAEKVNLDISTISRVANSKYVQAPLGTFLLKTFFSESMQKDSGEEVSTREIKKILSDFIDAEEKGKPLTDEQLTEILKDKGYNIARRTVAKYREQLNIPVARLRKRTLNKNHLLLPDNNFLMEKRIAQVISVVFYPLFVPTYAFAILLTMPAYFSAVMPASTKWLVIGLVFFTTCILPSLFIILMIKSGIISTTYLTKREDRTLPYIVSITFFYVTYYLLKRLEISAVYYYFMVGATFLNILIMGINFLWKISSHTASVGALAGMMTGLSYFLGTSYFGLIGATILVSGLVGFARLKLQAHTPAQIYTGFVLGFFTMIALFLYKT